MALCGGDRKTVFFLCSVFLFFVFVPLLFAFYTGGAWEDYYTTFRASKNLATGHGLVYTEGQKVQTFTSPLGVLVPALCSLIAGPENDDAALWIYRIISALLLGASGIFLAKSLLVRGLSPAPLLCLLILAALDCKTALYASNGMETGFMIFFLSLSWYAMTVKTAHPWKLLGVAWGGLMWSRPDAFVYAGALVAAMIAFKAGLASGNGRRWFLGQCSYGMGLAVLIYLPWFLWSWNYYGTPISHTIVAKGLRGFGDPIDGVIEAFRTLTTNNFFFQSPYFNSTQWNPLLVGWGDLLWLCAAAPVVLPRMSPLTRSASATFLIANFYLLMIVPFCWPWYVPNATWSGYLAIILAWFDLDHYLEKKTKGLLGWKKLFPPALLLVPQIILLCLVLQQMRVQQGLIETNNRKQIGLWLAKNSSPGETVFVECVGYIGYYSQLKMYDFPGMTSPEMVDARRTLNSDDYGTLITYLHPDWLVLRPPAINNLSEDQTLWLQQNYQPAKIFDVSNAVATAHIEGINIIDFDKTFVVFHRKL